MTSTTDISEDDWLEKILLRVIAVYQPEIIELYGDEYPISAKTAEQQILSHIKQSIERAKPEDYTRPQIRDYDAGFNASTHQYHKNLLKEMGLK